jgi:predicted Zn-dependent protease
MAVAAALVWAPGARAGSIVLTAEWMSEFDQPERASDSFGSIEEVRQAIASYDKRDYAACLQQLGQAVKAHPELPPAHALLAELAIERDRAAVVRPALERAISEDPSHPEVFLLFADLALMEGRLTDAAVHLEKATALASSRRWTTEQRDRFERLCRQGQASVAEGRGDWKAARTVLECWLDLEPANARVRQRLGKALFRLGQWDSACQELKRAAQEDATLEPATITMGRLSTEAGDLKKAEEWMDYAVKADPRSVVARTGMATWLLEQNRAEEADRHAATAVQLDPKSSDARRLLGLAARARKDSRRSEPIFEVLARESPDDAWVRDQLALVLAEQDDEAKRRRALELAERNVREQPNDPRAMATLGTVYYRLHRLDEAEKVLQAVVEAGRGSSDAAYTLARVRADRGHPEGAPELLKTALAAPGLFVCRTEAQQWLDRLKAASK